MINGDFVDFLAEADSPAATPQFTPFRRSSIAALSALDQSITHCDDGQPTDARVFDALAEFVRAGHRLTLLLGNHDIELALPPVHRALRDRLTGGGVGQIEFLFDGTAYERGPILIEHGNRYDGWNLIDYSGLRAISSALSREEATDTIPFDLQPGSRLVVEVMNPLKARYPFIDLLKPETEVVVPILRELEPDVWGHLFHITALMVKSALRKPRTGEVPRNARYIAATSGTPPEPLSTWLDSPKSLLRDPKNTARLKALRSKFLQRRKEIRETLDLSQEDPVYLEQARRLALGKRRIVIFGHTHLSRSIRLSDRAHYYNTGTWCPTMALDAKWYDPNYPEDAALADLDAFLKALRENRLEPWLLLNPRCAHVTWSSSGVVTAELCECDDHGIPVPIPGTERELAV